MKELKFPEGYDEDTFRYDYDDELADYILEPGVTRTLTLNARGELLEDNNNGLLGAWAQGQTYSANGAQVGDGDTTVLGNRVQAPPTTLQYDVRSNMAKCMPDPQWALNQAGSSDTWAFQYDGAGRQTYAYQDANGACAFSKTGAAATTYDAENHIQQTNLTWLEDNGPNFSDGTATWGPDGRQRVDSGGNTETAHWDGDTLLFSTSAGVPYLYIGKSAILDSTGDIVVIDRDERGTQMTSHGQAPGLYYTGITTGSVRNLYVNGKNGKLPIDVGSGSCDVTWPVQGYVSCPKTFNYTFAMARADGYQMVGGLVQGARTFDPTSGQWLTPDPYAGDVRDPMSQTPFMWNGNNPVQYVDPSGYTIDWSSMDADVFSEVTNLMLSSPTFEAEINTMENDASNVYSFDAVPIAQGTGQIQSNGAGSVILQVSAEDTSDRLGTELAHEVGHATDIANNLFSTFDHQIPGGLEANGESPTYEEAHGYMLEHQVLSEAFGMDKADSLIQDQLPQWNGIDQPAWSMILIQRTFCSAFGGASGC